MVAVGMSDEGMPDALRLIACSDFTEVAGAKTN